jgi:hypothetical protein
MLRDIEGELAGLRTTRDEYQHRLAALQQQIQTLPEVEARFQRLTRDYETHRENYQALVDRRQSMDISNTAGEDVKELRFKVIEPPNVSKGLALKAFWIEQLQFITLVLVGGLGAGAALAYALSQIRPAVYSRRVLSDITGLNVYGVISRVLTSSTRLRDKLDLVAFAAGLLTMLVAYGGVLIARYADIYSSEASGAESVLKVLGGGG